MTSSPRAVYDCNVLLQALISSRGPARGAVEAAYEGRVDLCLSPLILDELRDVAARPHVALKFSLTEERVAHFIAVLQQNCRQFSVVPHVFEFERDPKDAHYVDLAVAAGAKLIVSRDNDLLSLGDRSTAQGQSFATRFPNIEILTPTELLAQLRPCSP